MEVVIEHQLQQKRLCNRNLFLNYTKQITVRADQGSEPLTLY